ncbi:MAG: MBL fold metallo-hydrolase [Firmicutes bacterium]|nr:MBL fold metallo-hydrolase [Bacillota bacterium]
MWLQAEGTRLLIDPGPGALVRILASRPRLNPRLLNGILLTHRHLDHSGDLNVMVEAMTEGGTNPRGTLLLPGDAIDSEPVIFSYARGYLSEIVILREGGSYTLGRLHFTTPVRHRHAVETYGLKFQVGDLSLSIIADTGFFPELADFYRSEILVINTLTLKHSPLTQDIHLDLEDARRLIQAIQPKLAVLTHFGMRVLNYGPSRVARMLTEETGVEVIAADDEMVINLDRVGEVKKGKSSQSGRA